MIRAPEPKSTSDTRPATGSDPAALLDLFRRAERGDEACVPALRAAFADPALADFLESLGSPPCWLEDELVGPASSGNLALREAMTSTLSRLRRDLSGPAPSPAERLLAERAALCWWVVHREEQLYYRSSASSPSQAESHQRRIDRAHARFLSALKTLSTVRKLALPALQVNIAHHQVNTTGGCEV